MDRKLIHSSEQKISILQIVGFVVIIFGLIYLFIEQAVGKLDNEGGGIIAIDFFTIMLGIAFAFPDLLRDSNKGLSTMRIVVFMMINVICILLLKIGWGKGSLTDIGLNQYWMGVIAFVFGAKATQSFFESKMAVALAPPAVAAPPPAPAGQPPGASQTELDGCGLVPTQLTADSDLPASEGGIA